MNDKGQGIDDRILAVPVYGEEILDDDEISEHDHPSIKDKNK